MNDSTARSDKSESWFLEYLTGWTHTLIGRASAICVLVAIFSTIIVALRLPVIYPLFATIENAVVDRFFTLRSQLKHSFPIQDLTSDDIVLIVIDDETTKRLGQRPPFARVIYKGLLEKLTQADVVAFDFVLSGKSPLYAKDQLPTKSKLADFIHSYVDKDWTGDAFDDDLKLIQTFRKSNNIVLAYDADFYVSLIDGSKKIIYNLPYEPLLTALPEGNECLGNIFLKADADGVIRHGELISSQLPGSENRSISFPLRVLEKKLGCHFNADNNKIVLADHDYANQFKINYTCPPDNFVKIPLCKALADSADIFKHKVVLIGYDNLQPFANNKMAVNDSDLVKSTFIAPGYRQALSHLEIQANIIAGLVQNSLLMEPAWWENALILIFLSALCWRLFCLFDERPRFIVISVIVCAVLWLAFCLIAFMYWNLVLPVTIPIMSVLLPATVLFLTDSHLFKFEERKKQTKLFRTLASRQVAEEIDRQQLKVLGLEGKEAMVITMVCEVQNFAQITKGKEPQISIHMLDQILNIMTKSIYGHNGIVDRLLNTGFLVIWGAPIAIDPTIGTGFAAQCALDIQKRLKLLANEWTELGLLPEGATLSVVFGITTGDVVCGTINAKEHTAYGAIGSKVEMAISCAFLNKEFGTKCLIGKVTAEHLGSEYEVRRLVRPSWKAWSEEEEIYELVGRRGELSGVLEESVTLYKQALSAMDKAEYAQAKELILTALRVNAADEPTVRLLNECNMLAGDTAPKRKVTASRSRRKENN